MTLIEAKATLRDENVTPGLWAIAAGVVYLQTPIEDRLSAETLELLLICLKRKGGAMGSGALGLYVWTERSVPKNELDWSHDPAEWRSHLKAKGLLV